MDFKKFLQKLKWRDFSVYPDQGADVYLHCLSESKRIHRFLKVSQFNAVSFNPREVVKTLREERGWRFGWLPASLVETAYDSLHGPDDAAAG